MVDHGTEYHIPLKLSAINDTCTFACCQKATTGSGGWPMSVWLTPDLKPIFGGTYFPPDERYYNRTGFKTLLLMIAEKVQKKESGFPTIILIVLILFRWGL